MTIVSGLMAHGRFPLSYVKEFLETRLVGARIKRLVQNGVFAKLYKYHAKVCDMRRVRRGLIQTQNTNIAPSCSNQMLLYWASRK